jgi:cathepsin L
MKTFLALALAGAVSAIAVEPIDMEFMRYVVEHNKSYATVEEYELRKDLFKATHEVIKELNAQETTSTHGHNFLSDWTPEERQKLLGLQGMKKEQVLYAPEPEALPGAYPSSFDWRTYGVVNPVKNQGQCGSCYSFATTAVLESNNAIYNGILYNLSE